MSTSSTISCVHTTVGFYHIFLVSLCHENDYLVYIYVFSHYCVMLGYVTIYRCTILFVLFILLIQYDYSMTVVVMCPPTSPRRKICYYVPIMSVFKYQMVSTDSNSCFYCIYRYTIPLV